MKEIQACKVCGEKIEVIVEHLPFYKSHNGVAVVCCMQCGNSEAAPAGFDRDMFADAAIERWNSQAKS